MIIQTEMSSADFKPWSGAICRWEAIRDAGKFDELDMLIEELYPDGLTDTQLNDLLWFEEEWLFETLGIIEEDEYE